MTIRYYRGSQWTLWLSDLVFPGSVGGYQYLDICGCGLTQIDIIKMCGAGKIREIYPKNARANKLPRI